MRNFPHLVAILCSLSVCLQVQCGQVALFNNITEICKEQKYVDVMLDFPATELSKFKPVKGIDYIQQLVDYIRSLVQGVQKNVLESLIKKVPGIMPKSLWISNSIGLLALPCDMVFTVANIPGTFEVREEMVAPLSIGNNVPATIAKDSETGNIKNQWGLQQMRVPNIWSTTTGAGIVVGNIDTGVRATHEALRDTYRRSEFGWLNGYTNISEEAPYDEVGHGTHTMGTIVGRMGIGVAPNATWVACKGCTKFGCSEIALLTCGQWMMCPYRVIDNETISNCSMRPRIVSNSWGGSTSTPFFDKVVELWHKADIIPIFSAGNFGPKCSTVGSPGDGDNVISVGANDRDESMGSFSSRGPSKSTKKIKPEVVAPGVNIVSAWFDGDSNYTTLNGTSMAAPHIAGVVVLMASKFANISFSQVLTVLTNTAFKAPMLVKKQTCSCLSILDGPACPTLPANWPNNAYGAGRVDASQAFAAAV